MFIAPSAAWRNKQRRYAHADKLSVSLAHFDAKNTSAADRLCYSHTLNYLTKQGDQISFLDDQISFLEDATVYWWGELHMHMPVGTADIT